jgi:hypothetical protein
MRHAALMLVPAVDMNDDDWRQSTVMTTTAPFFSEA